MPKTVIFEASRMRYIEQNASQLLIGYLSVTFVCKKSRLSDRGGQITATIFTVSLDTVAKSQRFNRFGLWGNGGLMPIIGYCFEVARMRYITHAENNYF